MQWVSYSVNSVVVGDDGNGAAVGGKFFKICARSSTYAGTCYTTIKEYKYRGLNVYFRDVDESDYSMIQGLEAIKD
jgi:hypothetical protein